MTNEIKEAITEALELVYLKQVIKGELFKAANEEPSRGDSQLLDNIAGKLQNDKGLLKIMLGE